VEWINLAQDRGHWRAVVNALMNLFCPINSYFKYLLSVLIL
jgi:hypothetical protein